MSERQSEIANEKTAAGAAVLSQARDIALNLAVHASGLIREEISRQSSRSASNLEDLATGLRSTAKQLSQNAAAPLLHKTADQLERLSELLQEPDLTAIGRSIGRIAVERPWLFMGGAIAAGVAAGRVVKSAIQAPAGASLNERD